jgi:hypothetical protein
MRLIAIVCAAASAVAVNSPALSQAPHPLLGNWSVEYERGRQVENGVATPIMGKGALAIVVQGDSLVATLTSGPRPDGTTAPPAVMSSRPTADGAVFVQKSKARVNVNGDTQEVEMTLTWTLRAAGAELTGTLAREIPAFQDAAPPTPVKGTRTG